MSIDATIPVSKITYNDEPLTIAGGFELRERDILGGWNSTVDIGGETRPMFAFGAGGVCFAVGYEGTYTINKSNVIFTVPELGGELVASYNVENDTLLLSVDGDVLELIRGETINERNIIGVWTVANIGYVFKPNGELIDLVTTKQGNYTISGGIVSFVIDGSSKNVMYDFLNNILVNATLGFGLTKVEQTAKLIRREVTENKTYKASDDGADGYSEVVVNVASSGDNKLLQLVNRTITSVSSEELTGATNIGDYAFYNCTKLTDIDIPSGITAIKQNAFYNCTSLREINIPQTVATIANYVFNGCTKLTKVTLSEGLAVIGNSAFNNCSGLTEITIPASIAQIGSQAFAGSFKANITMLATNPPVLTNSNAVSSNVSTIYIPSGTLSKYQSASNWSNFSSKFVEV